MNVVERTPCRAGSPWYSGACRMVKFGANAAWFRLNVLTYNLLTALKRLTLPGDLRTARPKRLRFLLFNTVGKVVAHARRTLLRLTGVVQHALLVRARGKIARLAPA